MNWHKSLERIRNEKGFAIIFVVIALVALIGFLGLGIDVGYTYMAKGQLQNAADAGALAGVERLYPPSSPPTPNWDSAVQEATAFVQNNMAAGVKLKEAEVVPCYWTPSGICQPYSTYTPTTNDFPAVQVTVRKSTDNDNGPVPTFFAKVLGWNSFSVSAKAVAAVKPAGTMTGDVLPIAIKQSLANNNPINSGSGQSGLITLKPDAASSESKWTTLKEGNGSNTVKNLTDPTYVLTTPISVGDSIEITTGEKTSIYNDIDSHSNTIVYLPVLADFSSNTIVGFIPFFIQSATGGSIKTITGYFKGQIQTKFAIAGGSSGGGSGAGYGTFAAVMVH